MNETRDDGPVSEQIVPDSESFVVAHSRWMIVLLLLIVAAVVTARVRLVELPLERDEGEYAYGAQLLRHGGQLYRDLHTMKWPGSFGAYALFFAIGGESITTIHVGLLLVNLLTAIGVFLLAGELTDRRAAGWAAVSFVVLSVLPAMHGIIANAEHFALLFAVFGLWCLVHSLRERTLTGVLIAGALLGMGSVMKQHAHAYVLFGGIATLLTPWPVNRSQILKNVWQAAVYSVGVLLVWAAMCVTMAQMGVWDEFFTWTMVYPRDYASQIPLSLAPWVFMKEGFPIVLVVWPTLLLAGFGLAAAVRSGSLEHRLWAIGLLLAGGLSVCPGFYFRPHYFLMAIPPIALLCGFGAKELLRQFSLQAGSSGPILAIGCCGAIMVLPLLIQHQKLYITPLRALSRSMYGGNLFVESPRVGEFLKEQMDEQDRMVILGSEPQLCFYADRRLATGDVYMYPLTEVHSRARSMQEDMIRNVTAAKPRFAVTAAVRTSWLRREKSEELLFEWVPEFLQDYQPIGFVKWISPEETEYRFAKPGQTLDQREISPGDSPSYFTIFRRKDGA